MLILGGGNPRGFFYGQWSSVGLGFNPPTLKTQSPSFSGIQLESKPPGPKPTINHSLMFNGFLFGSPPEIPGLNTPGFDVHVSLSKKAEFETRISGGHVGALNNHDLMNWK